MKETINPMTIVVQVPNAMYQTNDSRNNGNVSSLKCKKLQNYV